MRNFHKIGEGWAVLPLLHAVQRHSELWNAQTFRTKFPNTPHADADDIWLRFTDEENCKSVGNVIGDQFPVWQPAARIIWTYAKPLVLDLMRGVEAYELGRVLVTRLAPGKRILPHADKDGEYVQEPDRARYHIVLQGLPGSLYTTGNETVQMKTGDVWWFNAHEVHEVMNNSVDDRIHLLVDVRTMP